MKLIENWQTLWVNIRLEIVSNGDQPSVNTGHWISFKVPRVSVALGIRTVPRSVYLFLPLTFYTRNCKYYHVPIRVYTSFFSPAAGR